MSEAFAQFDVQQLTAIEQSAQRIGREIFDRLDTSRARPWQRRWWDERMMHWAMDDDDVKVQMFRFVDVLPMLASDEATVRHLQEYFHEVSAQLPLPARWTLHSISPDSLAGRALARAARSGAQNQARRFIAGANLKEVGQAVRRERKQGRAFTLDILGEAVISDVEAERFFAAYRDLIEGIASTVNGWPEVESIDRDHLGQPLPRVNVSVKLSALDSQADEIDPAGSTERIAARLRELLRTARANAAFINIDMESRHLKDLTLHVVRTVLMEEEFRELTDVGIVIQCYLKDAGRDLAALRDWAERRGAAIWVRLVKGAYWDYESAHALAEGWPVPVYQEKHRTDANYEQQSRFLLQNSRWLRPALASHNVRSLAYALAVADHLELPPRSYELQMLYGMADPEKAALVEMGHRLRVYMPYGELIPGMAYLVRRLLENTSNDSFLRMSFAEHIAPEKLLMNPLDKEPPPADVPEAVGKTTALPYWKTFQNEPATDFAVEANRQAMQAALDAVRAQLGAHRPLVIAGESVDTPARLESRDPSQWDRLVGTTAMATAEHVDRAVTAARGALADWSALDADGRAKYLRAAAETMRVRRFEIAAWEVFECAKGWREADGDVCEAIDFLEFYAAGAVDLERPLGKDVPGEENTFCYLPRGVAAVIAPWNFPLAILTGMTSAALATGNTVVMKPAEQSPLVAALLMDIFAKVGLPAGVLHYLPGAGEEAGAALVDHPQTALIAFTGSREVGLAINARAAEVSRSSTQGVKRVIAEMGGKNAILIDENADLDEAVAGVVHSAFGFQGQKCSACSRAIVLDPVYDQFVERLVEATRSLQVGPAEDPASRIGPVIDRASRDKVLRYIELGREEGRAALAVDVGPLAEQGWFVGPHIFSEIGPHQRLAQEEVFGPVLAVIRAADLDEAIRIANGTDYALTAGVYSRSPANLERAARELLVGNLYLNRQCTGALVGRQPFGGFKLSGIGSKAGGPDYLLQFVLPKTITENTMRRGFAPPGDDDAG
jgi:RHH-type proline utilization regulon transcriptional repressor/proline dehydrogenase/delta 1-pyrroline-5-carboxylate dehydrogenase